MLLKSTSLNTTREDLVALFFSLFPHVAPSTIRYARTRKHVSPVGQIFVSIFPLPLAQRSRVSLEEADVFRATLAKRMDEYRDGTGVLHCKGVAARATQRRVVSNVVARDNEMALFQRRPSVWKVLKDLIKRKRERGKKEAGRQPIVAGKLCTSEIARSPINKTDLLQVRSTRNADTADDTRHRRRCVSSCGDAHVLRCGLSFRSILCADGRATISDYTPGQTRAI